ncbi:DNA-binding protein [Acidianus hospitalis]|uniref:DNA-binding protein n=1 Tax=Acidianus hospitalis TaxID=563177 RepID=A0A2T9X3M2_9CREN|nr:DNA-binding protein [Acidianus hospitalis]
MSFLLKNSRDFLHVAKRDFEEGLWNLVLFHSEQALQLCVKYKIYLHTGDYPKTHNLNELFSGLSKFEKIDVDTTMLDLLTQSYITSRYLPYSFSKETAEKALSFAEKIMKELNCLS